MKLLNLFMDLFRYPSGLCFWRFEALLLGTYTFKIVCFLVNEPFYPSLMSAFISIISSSFEVYFVNINLPLGLFSPL